MSTQHRVEECWRIPADELDRITPTRAMELLTDCFFHAQKEHMRRAKQMLGKADDEQEIRKTIHTMIRLACREVDCSFDSPDRRGMLRLIDLLAEKSHSMGTPEDIIEHHRKEAERLAAALG